MRRRKPKPGSRRIRSFFAWTPFTLANETRWLERVHLLQQADPNGSWVTLAFLERDESADLSQRAIRPPEDLRQ